MVEIVILLIGSLALLQMALARPQEVTIEPDTPEFNGGEQVFTIEPDTPEFNGGGREYY